MGILLKLGFGTFMYYYMFVVIFGSIISIIRWDLSILLDTLIFRGNLAIILICISFIYTVITSVKIKIKKEEKK